MPRVIALLRGINLGASRRVPMAKLREALEAAGYEDVATLAQSGNVVLSSGRAPVKLERELETALNEAFGIEIGVVVRTRDELAEVIASDPFGAEADDPRLYQVSFLSGKPDTAGVKVVESAATEPERVAFRGREVYAWHPGGIARSQLAKQITDRRLGVEVTARNWRMVGKLLALADKAAA